MEEIQELRVERLIKIKAMENVKKVAKDKYKLDIENNGSFIDKIKNQDIDIDTFLFDVEKDSYKKLKIFSIRDKDIEELTNPVFKDEFIKRNRIKNMENKETIKGLNDNIRCTYFSDTNKYFVIKMAQKRLIVIEKEADNGILEENFIYYDSVKFVIDKEEALVFMFYNDANMIADCDVDNGKAITQKKKALYTMFAEGNKRTLNPYDSSQELSDYVLSFLKEYEEDQKIKEVQRHIVLIETKDPVENKNNLRSSKKDCRHNKYRLQAIKYALENEDHVVKMLECELDKRIVIIKENEIILDGPFFGMEVINNVCKEIFPEYKLYSREDESERRNIQYP